MPLNSAMYDPATDWVADLNAQLNTTIPHSVIVPARVATDATETVVFRVPTGAQSATITSVSFISGAAITGAATNYQTLSTRQVHSATAAAITGATTFATTASLAAFTSKYLFQATGSVAALVLKPGDCITLKDASTGTGAALPEMTAVVEANVAWAAQ